MNPALLMLLLEKAPGVVAMIIAIAERHGVPVPDIEKAFRESDANADILITTAKAELGN